MESMVQPSFKIESADYANTDLSKANLYVDFGQGHLFWAIMLSSSRRFIALEFYQFKQQPKQEELKSVIYSHPVFVKHFNSVLISFNTRESVLLPGEYYEESQKEPILTTIHGDLQTGVVLSEKVNVADIRNIYRVPDFYRDDMARLFPGGHYWHVYSVILKSLEYRKNTLPSEFVYLIFYPSQIIVVVYKEKKLQLIQTFPYDIPEDVSYHLLNIADQFSLSPDDILIRVSGLIDTDSVLYAELMKYFINVETDPRPGYFSYDEAFDEYPAHFFTPVFSLGLCV